MVTFFRLQPGPQLSFVVTVDVQQASLDEPQSLQVP
jgi:hypothetical protein